MEEEVEEREEIGTMEQRRWAVNANTESGGENWVDPEAVLGLSSAWFTIFRVSA
jgi:hypothetical protein